MIDKIQTFGDSFLFGSDLSDCDNTTNYSHKTWPALIAKNLNLKYNCHAFAGSGNLFIMHNVLSYADTNSLAIINWTWQDRFDHNILVGMPGTVRPDDSAQSKFFYKELHSELDDKLRSLVYIYTTHQYLKQKNIKFISSVMDKNIVNQSWKKLSPAIRALHEEVEEQIQTFPNNQTFLEWSRANGYPESDNWHPLEPAHEKAAEYWQPIYEKLINTHITTT